MNVAKEDKSGRVSLLIFELKIIIFRHFPLAAPSLNQLITMVYSPPPTDVPGGKSVGEVDKLASRFCSFTMG